MNIGVISLGCAKNQVDTQTMLGYLKAAGHTFTAEPEEADVLIVNTCGFITPAKEESIDAILEMAQYKETGRCRLLVVTGCLSQRYPKELREEMPEVDIFLGVREYEKLPRLIAEKLSLPCSSVLTPERLLVTPPYRAYLRIGDGCNNRCAYCAIPLIRGNLVSTPTEQLIDEAKALADMGVTELSVIAQDTSGYGKDLYGEPRMIPLLKALDRIDGLRWVRLLYTYPDTVTPALLDTLAEGEKLVPYLDMPLQHCNDEILRRMHRRGSKAHIQSVLDHIRNHYPDFTLRTTMMVGFPGETDAQFDELMQFLRDYPFDRVGAFAFSPEEGTAAAEMPDQIEDGVKEARLNALMEQQQAISQRCNERWIGHELTMLVEETGMDGTYGRTIREAPDADGTVCIAPSYRHEPGQYLNIRLTKADPYDMIGESL
ncbi:MAG: 30S ribosomal protein S12 methylthiotransferase RimO [Clostridia bacterium]|nr:30S ribosomal protein S12 methylthiotransferase RimO [Clostridia bacterium]